VDPLRALGAIPLNTGGSLESLSGSLRGHLVRTLPPVLYQGSPGWGHTARVANGIKWRGQGLHVHPEVQYALKNDGTWRQVQLTAENLADTLVFDLRNLQHPEPGRMTFDVFVSFDARIDVRQQNWESGVRLYDGSVRAKGRVRLLLHCEASARLEPGKKLLPDAVLRLHVVKADAGFDNFKVEHVAGVGGELAKVLGDAVRGGLRQWRPSLERELLAKAEAALVKAGDTREVRVNVLGLLRGAPGKSGG
jgi:hypothetical protein